MTTRDILNAQVRLYSSLRLCLCRIGKPFSDHTVSDQHDHRLIKYNFAWVAMILNLIEWLLVTKALHK